MVLLATPSNGSLPPCTTGKRCSSGHVIRPGTPAQRRLGVLPYAGFMSSVTVQVLARPTFSSLVSESKRYDNVV